MPEWPDIQLYLHALRPRVVGRVISGVRVVSPFVLRTFDPPVEACVGRRVRAVDRIGKAFAFDLTDGPTVVVHLMIAGRWRWSPAGEARSPGKIALASVRFDDPAGRAAGTLHLVEPGPKKRAAMHLYPSSESARAAHARGGLDPTACAVDAFVERLRQETHTLKRALTDPRLFDGIGNAYSDEILHAAGLSPLRMTNKLSDEEARRLAATARDVLAVWARRLIETFGDRFPRPGDVTAFRPEFAVHGRFGKPCPVCGTAVQRIRYAENETNYCPRCQTDGALLADRSLSRLLKGDRPRHVDEIE